MTDVREEARVVQGCDRCGVSDTEPRHHVYDPANGGISSLHFACCEAQGCEVCRGVLSDSSDAQEVTG